MKRSPGRVLVGMSGGVDSSVAAAILKERGFEVTGVTFRLWLDCDLRSLSDPRSCCSVRDMEMAADVAAGLGIEHMIVDLSDPFYAGIVEPFAADYMAGRTPNPCIECNSVVKFPKLRQVAREIGADYIATGHYSRVSSGGEEAHLLRAADRAKDQSYALYRLGREELELCIFPNGDLSKPEVRAAAQHAGLPSAQKRESQELCFISGRDYRDFLAARFPDALLPGPIKDHSGRTLGEHKGLAFYTIGQRSGLGLAGSQARYVTALESESRSVIVGTREEVPGKWLGAESPVWRGGSPPAREFEAEAMVRYNSPPAPCSVWVEGDRFELSFKEPVWAITPGQHAVLYDGDSIIGGGVIAESR
jgi:tRNA-uridine 2-sulfurtransferase